MNIGSVAEATGLPAKTIRYYESIGLVGPAERSTGNYRLYGEREVMTLRFIERARRLGFSLKEVKELLALWHDRQRASADVRRLAQMQMHLRKLPTELCHQRPGERTRHRRRHAKRQRAGLNVITARNLGGEARDVTQDRLGTSSKNLAVGCQRHAARVANEKCVPQARLEIAHLPAQHRLGHAQAFGRAGQAAHFGNR